MLHCIVVLVWLQLAVGFRSTAVAWQGRPTSILRVLPIDGRDPVDAAVVVGREPLISQLNRLYKARNNTAVCDVFLDALDCKALKSYSLDRISYNIAIQAMLKCNRRAAVKRVLDGIAAEGKLLAPDTIHILISDAFARRDIASADALFDEHFIRGGTAPNVRSFNIMIEGHRVQGDNDRARQIFALLESNNLPPDLYTYSSLIRMAEDQQEIIDIVERAARDIKVTPPVVRCAVESLGKLGSPSTALSLSLKYLASGNESVFESHRSADAVITALLSETSSDQQVALPIQDDVTARADTAAFYLAGSEDAGTAFKVGSKGFCLLFSHLYSLSQVTRDGSVRGFDATLQDTRDKLWRRLRAGLVASTSSSKPAAMIADSASSSTDNPDMLLNGRLSYAVLRCYSHDIAAARTLWKQQLLPLAILTAKNPTLAASDTLQEISEKSLEALIFSCGLCVRPDIGLEIAISVRKRNWSRSQMATLSRRYFEGRTQAKALRNNDEGSGFVNRGLEASLMSELGAFDEGELERAGRGVRFRTIRFKL